MPTSNFIPQVIYHVPTQIQDMTQAFFASLKRNTPKIARGSTLFISSVAEGVSATYSSVLIFTHLNSKYRNPYNWLGVFGGGITGGIMRAYELSGVISEETFERYQGAKETLLGGCVAGLLAENLYNQEGPNAIFIGGGVTLFFISSKAFVEICHRRSFMEQMFFRYLAGAVKFSYKAGEVLGSLDYLLTEIQDFGVPIKNEIKYPAEGTAAFLVAFASHMMNKYPNGVSNNKFLSCVHSGLLFSWALIYGMEILGISSTAAFDMAADISSTDFSNALFYTIVGTTSGVSLIAGLRKFFDGKPKTVPCRPEALEMDEHLPLVPRRPIQAQPSFFSFSYASSLLHSVWKPNAIQDRKTELLIQDSSTIDSSQNNRSCLESLGSYFPLKNLSNCWRSIRSAEAVEDDDLILQL